MSIQELADYIKGNWEWKKETYPLLEKLVTPAEQLHFQRQHTLHHLQKQVGGLADQLEDAEHGIAIDPDRELALISKLLLNTLELMTVTGRKEEDVTTWIKNLYENPRHR